ncbi:MAG TPA: carboxypeptidase-like regulatory domain-containing protein [Burkholderiaceae bacterium]|jgi:hypothetical protein|nr:carboxypeptidase-like regulatory domain-containing protein [Burkholderiaceae bacterium]
MTVDGWQELTSERGRLFSPIGLRLVDDFTSRSAQGRLRAWIDRQVSPGVWAPTDLAAVFTPSGAITWPGLGRLRDPLFAAPRRYRARVSAERYRPAYLESADGVEFDAPPWNDENDPNPVTRGSTDLYLYPAPTYDFPTWVRVLRGFVQDAQGAPVANVKVHLSNAERVLSDERGVFALPLRWATNGQLIDAVDARGGRSGQRTLSLPADLQASVTITIA